MDELREQLNKLANGESCDSSGLVAEMIKVPSDNVLELILILFKDVITSMIPPSSWKKSKIAVLCKSGDAKLPGNYRPITLLPILYELFTKLLLARVKDVLERAQTVDQAGFRASFSCEDHLFTITLLAEIMFEYRSPLWVCAIDFVKVFDSVEQCSLWKALLQQSVPEAYVRMLQNLYVGQFAQVVSGQTSYSFPLSRGTKQGDPISPSLFNAVLEFAIKGCVQSWRQRGWGIAFSEHYNENLCTLRFADDVLILAASGRQMKIMLKELKDAVRKVGLELHPGKTKVLLNEFACEGKRPTNIDAGGSQVEVLAAAASTKYLGRLLNISSPTALHETENSNRIAVAWRKFWANRRELCDNSFKLRHRLRFFDQVITLHRVYCMRRGVGLSLLS